MVPGCSRSQIACKAAGSSHEAAGGEPAGAPGASAGTADLIGADPAPAPPGTFTLLEAHAARRRALHTAAAGRGLPVGRLDDPRNLEITDARRDFLAAAAPDWLEPRTGPERLPRLAATTSLNRYDSSQPDGQAGRVHGKTRELDNAEQA
jgi:hypothetical protein